MVAYTVLEDNGYHVRVRVSSGPDRDRLATAGILTFRSDEWARDLDTTFAGAFERGTR